MINLLVGIIYFRWIFLRTNLFLYSNIFLFYIKTLIHQVDLNNT